MTARTDTIDQSISHRTRPERVASVRSLVAVATRGPRAVWMHIQQAGQLGPLPETELGRHFGSRI